MKWLLRILGVVIGAIVLLAAFMWLTLRPNIPGPEFELQPATITGGKHVLLFGATGNLGVEIASDLVARGDKVTAFVRKTSDLSALEPLGVDFFVGDALDADSVRAAFEASEYDAAIAALAAARAPVPPDYLGNANVMDGALATGVKRVILISTVGAGNSKDAAPFISQLLLAEVLELKTKAENKLIESGLDYTIIRPGGLPFGPETGEGVLSENPATMGFINRPDLARLVVGVLDDGRTIGKILAAVDPTLSAPWDDGT